MDIDHDTETDWYSAAKEKRIQDSIDAKDETPLTNAVWRKHVGFSPQSAADAYELAGNLERQLSEAIKQRDMSRAAANSFRQCAEVIFGTMPFPRKFHWENATD